jgi:hypothetical protein
MMIELDHKDNKLKFPSQAWLQHDGTHLYVGIENAVDPTLPMKTGQNWAGNEAVELAFAIAGKKRSPIIVLRGYTGGRFESSGEAGAPQRVIGEAAQGVEYAAKIVDRSKWTAEWRIPLASLGLDPEAAEHPRLMFNLSLRKTAPRAWAMWRNTRGCTWDVPAAGILQFVP